MYETGASAEGSCSYKASTRCKGCKSCLINLSHLILIAAERKYHVLRLNTSTHAVE